jgi:hypothetical protein
MEDVFLSVLMQQSLVIIERKIVVEIISIILVLLQEVSHRLS